MKTYFVYVMTNFSRTLYIGVTNNLERRVMEYRLGRTPGFTSKYRITQLVYYEATNDIRTAIEREKQLKGWTRRRKIELIETMNPHLVRPVGWLRRGLVNCGSRSFAPLRMTTET